MPNLITMNIAIVDDDFQNTDFLNAVVSDYFKSHTICGCYHSIEEAAIQINSKKPELLILDVELNNGKNCFDLLKLINEYSYKVIIVSAHEKYALQAIKRKVAGYILKPVALIELFECIEDVVIQSSKSDLSSVNPSFSESDGFISVNTKMGSESFREKEIAYIKAAGRYSELFLQNGRRYVVSKNLGFYESTLEQNLFYRIHESFIVNKLFIVRVVNYENELLINWNTSKLSIPISRRRKSEFLKFLKLE